MIGRPPAVPPSFHAGEEVILSLSCLHSLEKGLKRSQCLEDMKVQQEGNSLGDLRLWEGQVATSVQMASITVVVVVAVV